MSKYKISNNNSLCPICNMPLLDNGEDLWCRNRIKINEKLTISHFEIQNGNKGIWYVPPFKIVYNEGKSDIYKFKDASEDKTFSTKGDFCFLFSTESEIKPDDPVKVTKRIQKLIIFL